MKIYPRTRKIFLTFLALLTLFTQSLFIASPVLAARNKAAVCHINGNGVYHLINVAPSAVPAHLAHGDSLPGDDYPGLVGYIFDDDCRPELVYRLPAAADDALTATVNIINNYGAGTLFANNGSGADDLGLPVATLVSFGDGSFGGSVTDNSAGATIAVPVIGGTLTVNADGSLAISNPTTPGIFTFEYRIENAAGFSDATVTVTIQAPPIAQDDSYTFLYSANVSASAGIGLFTDNGSGADYLGFPSGTLVSFGGGSLGGAVTDNAAGASAAFAGGTLTVNADGSWSLTGQPFTPGTYTFDYRIQNAVGASDATVTFIIQDPPTAQPDALTATVTVINNYGASTLFADSGTGADHLGTPTATLIAFGGGSLGGSVTDNPAGSTIAVPVLGGTLTVNADGSLVISNPTVPGIFTFEYRIENTSGSSDATVTVTIDAGDGT